PAIVNVEAGLGDEHLANRAAGHSLPSDSVKPTSQRGDSFGPSATRRGWNVTRWPTATWPASAPLTIEKMRCDPTDTIANTRGAAKPAGSPASWIVKAWIVPSRGRSTHWNRSDPQSGQNPRGGHAVRRQPAHAVVVRRPAASFA